MMAPRPTARRLFAVFAAVALTLTACGDGDSITVGSADFDEAEIVASMYAAVLEDAGYDVDRRFLFGPRETYFQALEDGELDLVPEYAGTLLEFLTAGAGVATSDPQENVGLLREELDDLEIAVLEPAQAENRNELVVTPETAEEHGLQTISDLQPVAGELVLGAPPECPERPLCLIGFQDVYGLQFADFQPLDAGGPLTVEALAAGDIDVALLFTTDQSIVENGWVILDDDQGLQPAENLVPVIRDDALDDSVADLLNSISERLTSDDLQELNRRVRVEGEDPEDVAQDWLRDQGLLDD